jgi:hypothetical protein
MILSLTMKIATPKSDGFQKKSEPLLPLVEDVELYKLLVDKTNSVSWEISTVPGTAGAATYKFQCRVLKGDETPRQMIRWRLDVMKLSLALMSTRWLPSNQSMRLACALDHCPRTVTATGIAHYITVDCLEEALGLTVAALLPRKILAKVKQSLCRDMQKPKNMKVCNYYQNIVRINNKEIPNLPPLQALQKLSNNKLTDIILFGTPKSWQNKMDQQGFKPMEQFLFQVIDFMEQVESVEEQFKKPKSQGQ